MKIYTKVGDSGKTVFFGCGMVSKDDPRIEAHGALDELNSLIGVSLCFIEDDGLRKLLIDVQNDLFQVGSDLAGNSLTDSSLPKIQQGHIKTLELAIDELEERLGKPDKFILPRGTIASSFLHLCRATTRRAERSLVKVNISLPLNPEMLKYVNRLSDFFYVLARQANKELDVKEQQPIYRYFNEKKEKEE